MISSLIYYHCIALFPPSDESALTSHLNLITMPEENNNLLNEEGEEDNDEEEDGEDEDEEFTPEFVSCSPVRLRKRPIPPITSDHSENAVQCRKKTRELPNISNCHSCGLRFPDKGRSESLQPLHSQWRVVFLCSGCLRSIQSAKVCSYCFSYFGESESGFIDCRQCSCRVHFACIPNQRGYVVPLDLDPNSFVCVDCCALPKYFSVKRGSCSNRDSNDDNFGSCHSVEVAKDVSMVDLDGVVRDATSVVLKKKAVASKARLKALEKALAANHAAELARKALNLAVLASKGLNTVIKTDAVNDQELALRLHKAMNGSRRILRNHCSSNPVRLFDLKKEIHNSSRKDIQICVENKSLDNVCNSDNEPLIQACLRYCSCSGVSSLSSPVRLFDLKREILNRGQRDNQTCVENRSPDNVGSSDSEPLSQADFQYSGDLRKDSSDQSTHSTEGMPVKVGNLCCLEKIENLHRGEDSDGSVSASCQRFNGSSGDLSSLRRDSRGDGEYCTSTQAKEIHNKSPDRYLFKYYYKRNCKLRSTVNHKGSIRSTSVLPQIHVPCSDDSGTYSDSACEAQMVTMHISASPNGLSGCGS